MPVEKSAGAIIFHKENGKIEYLLLKGSGGTKNWTLPKGLIEKGEDLEEAALRESREETGLENLRLIPGFKETVRFFFKAKYDYQLERGLKIGQTILKFVTYFLAESPSREVKISFEHEDYGWFSFEEAAEKLKKTKTNLDALKKADEFLK
jgi:8-oxo-dGTP pyrophosphatase MutT (NUDIX family)